METSTGESIQQSSEHAEGNEMDELQARAERLFGVGKLGECLLILDAAEAQKRIDSRQKLVVQMHIAARNKDWFKVLQLQKGADEKDVRTSYKKLAQQVHPDKCSCFGAEQAFKLLSEAVSQIMGSAEGGFVKETNSEQNAWWEKWDLDPASSKRKRRRDEDVVPQSEEETLNLRQCPIEELKLEVAKRQKAVLRPSKGTPDEKLTPAQRQYKVRAARAILSERLSYAQNAPKRDGGFL